MEKEAPNQNTKKINHSLHPANLNQRQKNGKNMPQIKNTKKKTSQSKPDGLKPKVIKWKKKLQLKNKKNPAQPKPDGVKPKAIKWKKMPQIKNTKKTIIA